MQVYNDRLTFTGQMVSATLNTDYNFQKDTSASSGFPKDGVGGIHSRRSILLLIPARSATSKFGSEVNAAMARTMIWITQNHFTGWGCSECEWNFPVPTLLADPEAKSAYDRLSSSKFADHDCKGFLTRLKSGQPASFTERMRKLVAQGLKPKDAVDIVLLEVDLESRGNPKIMEQARIDAQDFLRRVREGLI